jgi:hypothetical protein
MTKKVNLLDQLQLEYREESVKPAMVTALVAVMAIAFPLGWVIHKIGDAGGRAANISKYNDLASLVDGNVAVIRKVLANDVVDERELTGVAAAPVVTLITPDITPTNMGEAAQNKNELNVKLKAIYWNPRDPLVTIGDENYRIGDKVEGFKIKEIRKTEVVFMSPMGDTVVKYFYDYLDTPKRK